LETSSIFRRIAFILNPYSLGISPDWKLRLTGIGAVFCTQTIPTRWGSHLIGNALVERFQSGESKVIPTRWGSHLIGNQAPKDVERRQDSNPYSLGISPDWKPAGRLIGWSIVTVYPYSLGISPDWKRVGVFCGSYLIYIPTRWGSHLIGNFMKISHESR
jgi:hypothetical protein